MCIRLKFELNNNNTVTTKEKPLPNTGIIDIFFTISDVYAKYSAVSIASIIVNTNASVRFHIFDGGISPENKRKLGELRKLRNFEIEYLSVDKKKFANIPKSRMKHIDSDDANCRLLISTLNPDLDKCIVLDADLVVQGDIAQLWNVDIGDNYMAAVTDQFPLNPNSWAKKLPLPENYIYVNTGVSVMNLKKWREDRIEEKLFDNLAKYRNLLWFPDQDTLNITLAPHVQYLPHVFNAMPVQRYYNIDQEKEAFSDSVILHWAGSLKPWKFPWQKMANIYFHYAKMTPFYEEILYANIANHENIVNNTQILKDLREIALLPDYRRKLSRIRWKAHFSWGKRKQRYLKRKVQLKEIIKKIYALQRSL